MTGTLPAPFVATLRDLLGPKGWSDDQSLIAPRLNDWRGRWRGHSSLLAAPASTGEAAAVIRLCVQHRVPVTPQGGNTGLVGGQLPQGELLLSTHRLRAIREVSPLDDCIKVEAGVTLLETQQEAAATGRLFPLSLAAEGSATIGGAIATNAGGIAVLRYGMMRDLVLGIEAILPDGSVFNGLKRLRKDNSGYDMKQLLIGAEGTLGLVTAATLRLFPTIRARATGVAGLRSADDALLFLARAKALAGGFIEAFELMSRRNVELAERHIPGVRDPLDQPHAWYVLVELSGPDEEAAAAAMEQLLGAAFEAGTISDAAIAQSDQQRTDFWRIREEQTAAQRAEGASWSHDISVPVSRVPEFLSRAAGAVAAFWPGARPIPFGHAGDGNIHYNVVQPEGSDPAAFAAAADGGAQIIHALAVELGGSISAEHGLGRMKTAEALRYKSAAEIQAMRAIRIALDPHRIMNPGVLF